MAHDLVDISLDLLEARELEALSWGIAHAVLAPDELEDLIDGAIDAAGAPGARVEDVIASLEQGGLLFEVDGGYRTRMGETVRLLARLRQLFPHHLHGAEQWRSAPLLIHDYRLVSRPRQFPRRDVPAEQACDQIGASGDLTRTSREALSALLGLDAQGTARPLAKFQVDAAQSVLHALLGDGKGATMVSAGTGSGKTFAFYLPALTWLAAEVDASFWTKVLAIYPRIELLRDQFTSAVREALKLREVTSRPIRIGALFGSTPRFSRSDLSRFFGWPSIPGAHVCPMLRCPMCDGPLLWHEADRTRDVERLRCRDCTCVLDGDSVPLTRQSLTQHPPDVLFTTTETLHRHLASLNVRGLFGARSDAPRPPRLVLLDEAHTYSGLAGAQAAHVLRRWRHAVGAPVHVVGLSATLADAPSFIARLASVPPEAVTSVQPRPEDLDEQGREYMVALRGNPMSGTALLSATIQTLMLIRRMLDPGVQGPSGGRFGSRVFAFTDDLDVTNRLLFNLRDAEGRTSWGAPRNGAAPLAALREPPADPVEQQIRDDDGQVWSVPIALRNRLEAPGLLISRTSSQDQGVDPRSDVVVATASLEVGFDDERVGAVVQHKAPRDIASFVQRKGRAGRPQEMRPWTLVLLSDFGRDRLAYQGYDQLFDPTLRPEPLPIDNRHALKMQATAALLDWLAVQLAASGPREGELWTDLSGPAAVIYNWDTRGRTRAGAVRRQQQAAVILERVLTEPAEQKALEQHLRNSLKLSDAQLRSVLWEPPRAILLSAVPVLLRRLQTGWRDVVTGGSDSFSARNPFPEHLAPNLFGDLHLPEVDLVLPAPREGRDDRIVRLPIVQALRELTPGRVTRRYAVDDARARYWRPVTSQGAIDVVTSLDAYDVEGLARFNEGGVIRQRPLLRPRSARLELAPTSVRDSQTGFHEWHAEIVPGADPEVITVEGRSRWSRIIRAIEFHTHATGSETEVRRFSLRAETTSPADGSTRLVVDFSDVDGNPVALGYVAATDGIRIVLDCDHDLVATVEGRPDLRRSIRRGWYTHLVETSALLTERASSFDRGWLAALYLAAVAATAAGNNAGCVRARELVREAGIDRCLERALSVVFEADLSVRADDDGEGHQHGDTRAVRRLRDLFADREVTAELDTLGDALDGTMPAEAGPWLELLMRSTVAAAVREAFQRLRPNVDADELLIDLDGDVADVAERPGVWLTEGALGGAGVIEELAQATRDDPNRLLDLVQAALGETDFETADTELRAVLDAAMSDGEIVQLLRATRAATGVRELRTTLDELIAGLRRRGLGMSRPAVASLAARVLRPGATPESDALLRGVLDTWDDLEARLDLEVDPRSLAYALSENAQLEQAIALNSAPAGDLRAWRYSQLYGLLWPRGADARAASLAAYSPFARLPRPERLLVRALVTDARQRIEVSEKDWRTAADLVLVEEGECLLVGTSEQLRFAAIDLALVPTDLGYLHVHPRLVGMSREHQRYVAALRLEEAGP